MFAMRHECRSFIHQSVITSYANGGLLSRNHRVQTRKRTNLLPQEHGVMVVPRDSEVVAKVNIDSTLTMRILWSILRDGVAPVRE